MSPMHGFPRGTVLATDPLGSSVNRSLQLLDEMLCLAWNTQLHRFEVWRKELTPTGVFYGAIMPVVDDKGRFVEPGQWLVGKLKARDSAYAGPDEAIKNVLAEIHKGEEEERVAAQKRDDDAVAEVASEIAIDHTLEAQLKSDPHITGRRRYVWDKVASVFGQAGARERIREEGKNVLVQPSTKSTPTV
jgi:hypothetical protein